MPKLTYKLNDKQLNLLKLIYKFRFVTATQIADYKNLKPYAINNAFKRLMERELIKRHYNSSYKLHGKSARYYLAPASLKLLRDEHGLNREVLHARYKDHSISEPFMDHTIEVLQNFISIQNSQPKTFQIFTRYELQGIDHFPKLLPDLYLKRHEDLEGTVLEYFIKIYSDSTLVWVIKKDIDSYLEHYEDEGWTGEKYPTIILLVENKRTRDNLDAYIEKKKDELYIEDTDLTIQTNTRATISL
jgi:Mn-dependent DtxR family transcriptional regulator